MRPREDWIRLPDNVTPAIVSPELWQAANDSHRQRQAIAAAKNKYAPHLLRGMVWCGTCGMKMVYIEENAKTRVFRCGSAKRTGHSCGGGRIHAKNLEQAIWGIVKDYLKDETRLIAHIEQREAQGGQDRQLQDDLDAAKRQIARKKHKAEELLQTADPSSETLWNIVNGEVKRLSREIDQWQATIDAIELRQRQQSTVTDELIAVRTLVGVYQGQVDEMTFEEQRRILEAFKVRITGNDREVYMKWEPKVTPEIQERVGLKVHIS